MRLPVAALGGGAVVDPAVILVTPAYYDAFSYTDGTRLVAGDPNANAGQVATNPGNLGWAATTTLSASNIRYNAIVYQGMIVKRSSNNSGDFVATTGTYILSPAGVSISGDQYCQAGLQGLSGTPNGVGFKASDEKNRIFFYATNATVNVQSIVAGSSTMVLNVPGLSTARKMGGVASGFSLPTLTNDRFTCVAAGGKIYMRRGPGFPIGTAAGYVYTDPGGDKPDVATYNGQHQAVDFMQAGYAPTVLLITETFLAWYPKIRASSGASPTSGTATIPFSGTYIGTAPARLQWALFDPETGAIVKAWAWVATASQTIGGGNWSISGLAIPCGLNGRKAYAIGFRPVDASNAAQDGAAVVSIKHFYVTYNVALVGQSNNVFIANTLATSSYPNFAGGMTYQKADPPSLVQGTYAETTNYYISTAESNNIDKAIARLADVLSTQMNVPVSCEIMAISAQAAANLGPAGTNTNYIATHHAFAGNAFEALYLSHGEAEFITAGSTWLTQWVDTNLPWYLGMSGQPTGTLIPIFHAFSGRATGGATGSTLASTKALREGQDGFVAYCNAQLPNVLAMAGHHYVGAKMVDTLHYTAVYGEGYDEVCRRLGLSWNKYLTGSGYDGIGPIATTVTRSGAVLTLDFNLNGATSLTCRDGTDQSLTGTASALTSWEVSDDNFATTKTISSAVLTGNQVIITLSASPGVAVKVRNHYGFAPDVTSWVFGAYVDGTFIGSKPIITPILSS